MHGAAALRQTSMLATVPISRTVNHSGTSRSPLQGPQYPRDRTNKEESPKTFGEQQLFSDSRVRQQKSARKHPNGHHAPERSSSITPSSYHQQKHTLSLLSRRCPHGVCPWTACSPARPPPGAALERLLSALPPCEGLRQQRLVVCNNRLRQ